MPCRQVNSAPRVPIQVVPSLAAKTDQMSPSRPVPVSMLVFFPSGATRTTPRPGKPAQRLPSASRVMERTLSFTVKPPAGMLRKAEGRMWIAPLPAVPIQ